MNFADERLVKIYGTWVKVQVAFYDFMFKTAIDKPNPSIEDIEDFHHGDNAGYDAMVDRCLDFYETPELAWRQFLTHEGIK